MATVEQCEQALHALATRLAENSSAEQNAGFNRSLSCTLSDLSAVFAARLEDGRLVDITRAQSAQAQISLTLTSDDLLALVDGTLNMASAWASGRLKIDAGMLDLLRLRSIL